MSEPKCRFVEPEEYREAIVRAKVAWIEKFGPAVPVHVLAVAMNRDRIHLGLPPEPEADTPIVVEPNS